MDLDTVRLVGDGAAAFVGGSMGVAGTLAVYENNRFHAKQRVVCAYCASAPRNPFRAARPPSPPVIRVGEGTGYLKCATCMGTGLLADGSKCHTCEGADAARADGKHVCVNCEGTGLTIPAAFDRKEIKAQDDEIERQLDEIGIAALRRHHPRRIDRRHARGRPHAPATSDQASVREGGRRRVVGRRLRRGAASRKKMSVSRAMMMTFP
ncbi:hypothetical protein JL722_13412 [Aureococcus anophagefferens]|nr:hypothetical protein JL722_13412 [Aureococcus anophagefferens]